MKRWFSICLMTVIEISLTGCGESVAVTGPPTVPVKLAVTINGKPIAASVEVRLLPEPPKEGITVVRCVRTSDGTYALETYEPGDGAPPGTYQVQLGSNDSLAVGQTVPDTKPKTVIIPNQGGEVSVDLQGTGKVKPGLLPPPPGQG
jgi:hypothetical protein